MKNKLLRKLRNLKNRKERARKELLRRKYIEYYENLPLDEKAVFLEARNGKEIDGNIFYMIKVLLEDERYAGYRIYVAAEDESKAEVIGRKLARLTDPGSGECNQTSGGKGAGGPEILIVESEDYYRVCATAKYIICDSTLKNFFMKREGQIYLNVWHGTPFKVMGRRVIHEPHATGNAQKNFVIADYLLYPNRYMMDHMIEDYMLEDASRARILLGGYPRNSAFFDTRRREEVIGEQGLEGKRIYVYMPTYRPEQMGESLKAILEEMDGELREDEILFAKIHPLAAESVDFGAFTNIRAFPEGYETYEFLNAADCLITDYSSVFYDFAVTGRKIVLYTYDEEEYLSTRGLYEPMSSLPFTQVKTVSETLEAARSPKDYDDREFIQRFCSYESEGAADVLCEKVILGEEKKSPYMEELDMPKSSRENIFVYGGDLASGPRTDELMRWLEEADRTNSNYYLIFKRAEVKDHKEILLKLPEGIRYFGIAGKDYETGDPAKNRLYARRRSFGDMRVDRFIKR